MALLSSTDSDQINAGPSISYDFIIRNRALASFQSIKTFQTIALLLLFR